jgi:hypothetical protein
LEPQTLTQPIAQTDLGQLILLGNDIALQWWSATQNKPIPPPPRIPGTNLPYSDTVITTQMIVIGLLALGAIFLLKR